MKECQSLLGMILTIIIATIFLQTQSVTAVYSMNETCKFAPNGHPIADPNNCQDYGICTDGKLTHIINCSNGYLFDAKQGQCMLSQKAECLSTVKNICNDMASSQQVADPNDCSNYCYCKGDGTYTCTKCPENQYYDPKLGVCVQSSDVFCAADSICRLIGNGHRFGSPDRCDQWVMCYHGVVVTTGGCPIHTYYNQRSSYCENTKTCDLTLDVGLGVLEPLPAIPTSCLYYYIDRPRNITDSITCMGYYYCTDKFGPGTWHKCPLGFHFDWAKEICLPAHDVYCSYDRCGNIDQPFVAELGCESYLFCKNQTYQNGSGGSCKSFNENYPYFNEVLGGCVDKEPELDVCYK